MDRDTEMNTKGSVSLEENITIYSAIKYMKIHD